MIWSTQQIQILTIAKGNLDDAQKFYDMFKNLAKDNPNYIAALSRLTAAKTAYEQTKTNYDYLNEKPTALEVQKNDANLAIAQAQLADAQRTYDRPQGWTKRRGYCGCPSPGGCFASDH